MPHSNPVDDTKVNSQRYNYDKLTSAYFITFFLVVNFGKLKAFGININFPSLTKYPCFYLFNLFASAISSGLSGKDLKTVNWTNVNQFVIFMNSFEKSLIP